MQLITALQAIILISLLGFTIQTSSADKATKYQFETTQMRIVLIPRSAQQIAAFYEGRGFPARAIDVTRSACFFTIGIKNKSTDIIWLETDNWRFASAAGEIQRITRDAWKTRWQKMGLALAYQSTFRWTLLPASLDFRPDEREGGNITLPRTAEHFTVDMTFATGANKSGPAIAIHFESVVCG